MTGTRRALSRRLILLLALTTAAVAALFFAYAGVHRGAGPVRDGTAPAILDVTTAQDALRQANDAARNALESGQSALVGAGGGYRIHLAVANQSLAGAAEGDVTGDTGLRALQTVSGLIVAYSGWIERAATVPDDSPLLDAYLHYADTMLNRPVTGILARLDDLQAGQRTTLADQTTFGWPGRLSWAAALLLCAALAGALLETQRFLRHRFRRRHHPWLLGATAVTLAAGALLAAGTVQTQHAKDASRDQLAATVGTWRSTSGDEPTATPADVAGAIRHTAQEVETEMRDTDWLAGLTGWVPALGPVLGALILRGLLPRLAEYRYRTR
ncbi:hypothetical protein [Streptomyces hainanensis]|uniref:Uncharacterized protein n=1 Tax=Streptomyces hainanensis TaxID=402648 RepID=A0A4R4TBU2_9ACTN|nr:hypothetical protein [Streptomyces hainanensis]TDC74948.1 hypothetical protein E1283_14000 [Streptomyces hainanensis]